MRSFRVSVISLVILVTSLSVKVAMQGGETPLAPARLKQALVAEFGLHNYSASFEQRTWGVMARMQKRGCRMLIVQQPSEGSTKDRIEQLAQPFGPLLYVYRGRITVDPPRLEPYVRDRIVRELHQFGLSAERSPLLAVAASPGCSLQEINWSRLASFNP